MNIVLYPTYFK